MSNKAATWRSRALIALWRPTSWDPSITHAMIWAVWDLNLMTRSRNCCFCRWARGLEILTQQRDVREEDGEGQADGACGMDRRGAGRASGGARSHCAPLPRAYISTAKGCPLADGASVTVSHTKTRLSNVVGRTTGRGNRANKTSFREHNRMAIAQVKLSCANDVCCSTRSLVCYSAGMRGSGPHGGSRAKAARAEEAQCGVGEGVALAQA